MVSIFINGVTKYHKKEEVLFRAKYREKSTNAAHPNWYNRARHLIPRKIFVLKTTRATSGITQVRRSLVQFV